MRSNSCHLPRVAGVSDIQSARTRSHILRALLVSGLSPSIWRILNSEKQSLDSSFKIASARRFMWVEPERELELIRLFFGSTPTFISFLSKPLAIWRLRALEAALELADKHEASSVESAFAGRARTTSLWSELQQTLERFFFATCKISWNLNLETETAVELAGHKFEFETNTRIQNTEANTMKASAN